MLHGDRPLRRNPPARSPRLWDRGPPPPEAVAAWRAALIARRGCPPGTREETVRALRREGRFWNGVDPGWLPEAQVLRLAALYGAEALAQAGVAGAAVGEAGG